METSQRLSRDLDPVSLTPKPMPSVFPQLLAEGRSPLPCPSVLLWRHTPPRVSAPH